MEAGEPNVVELDVPSDSSIGHSGEPYMELEQGGNQDNSAPIEMKEGNDTNSSPVQFQPRMAEEEMLLSSDHQRSSSDSFSDSDSEGGTVSYEVNAVDKENSSTHNAEESDENEEQRPNSGSDKNSEYIGSNIDSSNAQSGENNMNFVECQGKAGIPQIIIDLAEDNPPPPQRDPVELDGSDTYPDGKQSINNKDTDDEASKIEDENENNMISESNATNQNSLCLDNSESSVCVAACARDEPDICSELFEDADKKLEAEESAFGISMHQHNFHQAKTSDIDAADLDLTHISMDISEEGHQGNSEPSFDGYGKLEAKMRDSMDNQVTKEEFVLHDQGESSDSIVSTPDYSDSSNSSGYPAVVPSDLPRCHSGDQRVQIATNRDINQSNCSHNVTGELGPNMVAEVIYKKGIADDDVIWADCYQVRRKEYVFVEEVITTDPTGGTILSQDKAAMSAVENTESPPAKRSREPAQSRHGGETPAVESYNEAIRPIQGRYAAPTPCPNMAQIQPEEQHQSPEPKAKERKKKGSKKQPPLPPRIPVPPQENLPQGPSSPSQQPPSSPLVKLRRKKLSFRRKDKTQQDPTIRHTIGSPFSGFPHVRLGSLSKEQGKGKGDDKKDKNEKEMDRPPEELPAEGENLVQRNVIIHRDEKGYGLTVSGDNPVFVQSVKENGAAAKAGVMQGDRIIKVHGTLVTNSNHIEVVKLIKSGSYVALTLLGRLPGQGGKPLDPPTQAHYSPPPPQSDRISGPRAVDSEKDHEYKAHKIATIRLMYEQVAEDYEKIRQDLQKVPVADREKYAKDVERKGALVRSLEEQLLALTGIPAESHGGSTASARSQASGLPPPGGTGLSSPLPSPLHPSSSVKGDSLDMIHEDKENYDASSRPPHPPANPAPWLPGGPRHRKADSMPETVLEGAEESPFYGPKDVSVSRSHSDSRKRAETFDSGETLNEVPSGTASVDEIERLRGDIKLRRRKMMQKTSSLPTSFPDSGAASDHSPAGSPNASPTPTPARSFEGIASELSEDLSVPTERLQPVTPQGEPTGLPPTPLASSPPRGGSLHHYQAVSPHQVDVVSMEDDFSTDEEHLDEHGPFSDLNMLKHRPAHLAVFLHYLISNSDPSPLLFYLVTESYSQGYMKEMRKWAYEIHSTFLVPSAPLRVNIEDPSVLSTIDHILGTKSDKEDSLKMVFQFARHIAQNEIGELLSDFRNKRALGLGSLYGDHELQDDKMDRQTELTVVERYLWPHFERLLEGDQSNDRNKAMSSALATFLKQVGVSTSKSNNALERCPSFVAKDRKMFKFKGNKKNLQRMGHSFQQQHYYVVTNCNHCQGVIWGIGNQGFQCTSCEYNIHKECFEKVDSQCTRKKKRMSTSSSGSFLGGIIPRKTSSLNPSAIKEAQRLQDEASHASPPTVTSSMVLHLRQPPKEEEEDLVREAQRIHEDNSITFGRTVSMPSVREGVSSPTRSTFYATAPATIVQDKILEVARSNNRVDQMRGKFEGRSQDESRSPMTPPRGRSPDILEIEDQKKGSTLLGRSESLNKKKESRKSVRRTRSDVQADDATIKQALNQSGSSSNSSISLRSLESPSQSSDPLVENVAKHGVSRLSDDSDIEADPELPPLDATIPKDVLKKLKPKEKKRQDVLNELFHTERLHVRHLKVMHRLFYHPIKEAGYPSELLVLLFPNIEELIEVHSTVNTAFKTKRKEGHVIGDVAELLLNRFEGENGMKFMKACATFCQNQGHALDTLRAKLRKDQKFALLHQECASNSLCLRLELKDMLPKPMQRLTKYPLLIENLLKYTQSANAEEHGKLLKALECSKSILSYVNQAVKDCENKQKLLDIQRRMDRRPFEGSSHPVVPEYRSLDLTRRNMVHEGSLQWRINRQKTIDLHVVLLEDILVLLQKQDDKLVLRCQSTTVVADTKFTHSPIIKLTNLLTRNVATDKKAFFLVSTSNVGPQIYELVANTVDERKKWFKYITDAAEGYKVKDQARKEKKEKGNGSLPELPPEAPSVPEKKDYHHSPERKISKNDSETSSETEFDSRKKSISVDSMENVGKAEVVDQPQELIQPNEVVVSNVHLLERVEPMLTTRELVKQKDRLIQKTMEEKKKLVAELLDVPPEEFDTIVDMAGEAPKEMQDARDLVLATIDQANQLTLMINTGLQGPEEQKEDHCKLEPQPSPSTGPSLNKSEDTPEGSGAECLATKQNGEVAASSVGSEGGDDQHAKEVSVSMPADPVICISSRLNQQLTQLLSLLSQREEAEKRLQQELSAAQEQLATLQLAHSVSDISTRSPSNSVSQHSRPNSFISVTSSASETCEVPVEVTADSMADGSGEDMHHESSSSSEDGGATPERVLPTIVTNTQEVEITTPMERLHVVTEDYQEAEATADTPSGDEDSFFEDAQSDTDSANLNVSREMPDNLDAVSCDTTDTDSTGNTVIGATF